MQAKYVVRPFPGAAGAKLGAARANSATPERLASKQPRLPPGIGTYPLPRPATLDNTPTTPQMQQRHKFLSAPEPTKPLSRERRALPASVEFLVSAPTPPPARFDRR